MSGDGFTFGSDRAADTVVVTLAGELDMAATFAIEPELERLTRSNEVRRLVVDMRRVEFMDSSVLGLLLATQQRLRSDGIVFVVANPSDSVRRILKLTSAGDALSVVTWPPEA